MSDENTQNFAVKNFFQNIRKVFKNLGFEDSQIISMDITAGAYMVTNPSGDLPRIICSIDMKNDFKIEYSQFSKSNMNKFNRFMTEVVKNNLPFTEGELIDSSTGTILADMTFDGKQQNDLLEEISLQLDDNKEDLTSLKLYLTFQFLETSVIKPENESEVKLKKEVERRSKLEIMDETALIIDFISKRTTKCIQSKHLLELFPKATRQECFKKLKGISEQGFLIQSGPWFLLNQ